MARRVRRHEEHENHERWMVSYADFMTLLFALFVVMYATSRADARKVRQVMESVRFATHFKGTGGTGALPVLDGVSAGSAGVIGGPARPLQAVDDRALRIRERLDERLGPLLQRLPQAGAVAVQAEGRRLTVRLAAASFFEGGQAALQPQSLALLDAVAAELVPLGLLIRVEGHSDELPYAGDRYRNDWDLSAARAATVVSYLEATNEGGRGRLAATGWAATRPLTREPTPEAQARNRRVELVVELQPDADGAAAR